MGVFRSIEKPARRLACGSGALERYVAVTAYYVDLLGCSDDGSALWVANDEGEILCIDSQTGEKCYYYQPNVIE